ncbi:MAG: DUF4331 domain-containing protein [Lysobacter sp.]|nr:DUF4331 domain-containing protein [Lysobacter sp.]
MKPTAIALALAMSVLAGPAAGSSHRDAPAISGMPRVDATDFYMFHSYEAGRQDFVTFIANYQPFQAPYGGPNYYMLEPKAVYTIHVDNNGDAVADHVFQFRFTNTFRNLKLPVNGVDISVPFQNIGPFSAASRANLNTIESYFVTTERGRATNLTVGGGQTNFTKPFDNIGKMSIADYESYARVHIAKIGIPGCGTPGQVFVGQRKDSFFANLGELFDLYNTNPTGPSNAEANDLADRNVTSIALEVPIACLTDDGKSGTAPTFGGWLLGAWTTARAGPGLPQVSRLSAPLINELFIGLQDKDRFNASRPSDDAQFARYFTHPALPTLIEKLFPAFPAPTRFPRTDLVAFYLTGFTDFNKPPNVVPAEMLRLRTGFVFEQYSPLGLIEGDRAGFPNGRRPDDDVVDITIRTAMGRLLPLSESRGKRFSTDGTEGPPAAERVMRFPYMRPPIAGSTGD